jgi:hypothetical protein
MPKFRSKLEEHVYNTLLQRGVVHDYESTKIPYILSCNYIPDFRIEANGTFLEVKGFLDVDDRRKMRAVKDQNPDLDVRFVFQKPHKLMPGAKSTNAQWAERHGFLWCPYTSIPDTWLK